MLAADIILVCSRNEAFGRVVVEGMKLGRPVVYTRSGGIPEYEIKAQVEGVNSSGGAA
jgi:glycosyltransferase involved in cell wall biosynthesis